MVRSNAKHNLYRRCSDRVSLAATRVRQQSRGRPHSLIGGAWEARPEPVQNINGKDIPGAPNGMLAEIKGSHASAKGAIAVDID